MKVLLIGGTGQVGWELRRTLAPLGEIVAPDRDAVDLTVPETIGRAVGGVDPDLVVNAAAYNNVDGAEDDRAAAEAVNAEGPGRLAEEAAKAGAAVLHYSTDYVFGGERDRPYRPSEKTDPVNVYGETKRAGEEAVSASGTPSLVLRTSWVYSLRRSNFLRTMLAQFRQREAVEVVDDQVSVPTWARTVAEVTAQLVGRAAGGNGGLRIFEDAWVGGGTFHLAPVGRASRHEFAETILEEVTGRLGLDGVATRRVQAIESADWPSAADRPQFSVLDSSKLAQRFGLQLPRWQDELTHCLDGIATCRALAAQD